MDRKHNRFGEHGCFICSECGKRTRDTGDNGNVKLCPACLEQNLQDNARGV